jgi:hypothetical protein
MTRSLIFTIVMFGLVIGDLFFSENIGAEEIGAVSSMYVIAFSILLASSSVLRNEL